jgi:hypothetical protein
MSTKSKIDNITGGFEQFVLVNKTRIDNNDPLNWDIEPDNRCVHMADLLEDVRDQPPMFCYNESCGHRVILCCGPKRQYIRHFRGYKGECNHYGEKTKGHGAKDPSIPKGVLRHLLLTKNLAVKQSCHYCKEVINIDNLDDNDYRPRTDYQHTKSDGIKTTTDAVLTYDGNVEIAFDVAGEDSLYISYKKTLDCKWFKLSAKVLFKIWRDKEVDKHHTLDCYNKIRCSECEAREKKEIDIQNRIQKRMREKQIKDTNFIHLIKKIEAGVTNSKLLSMGDYDCEIGEKLKFIGCSFSKYDDSLILLSDSENRYKSDCSELIESIREGISSGKGHPINDDWFRFSHIYNIKY